ncbi:MAG TPA: DUF4388 domain-containing protein [Planctomycetota bacterium]|nr:DUF4388 domain-containing protein [Planctomycetota bacterium]
MGTIHGDLSVLSLANLVQVLVLDRSVGLLTLECGNDRRILRISPTGVRLVRGSQRCHRLERVLRRTFGVLPPPSDEFGARIGRLVQEWMHEEICELFTWQRGTFKFEKAEAGSAPEEGPFGPFAADCDITTIAIDAARWADELPRIKAAIRDLRQVPEVNRAAGPLPQTPQGPEADDDVLRLIDGQRSVLQIVHLSIFPRFIVLQVLYSLCQQEAIRMKDPAALGAAPAVAA